MVCELSCGDTSANDPCLEPAPVAAVTAPKVSEETPKKSAEETPVEEDAKKAAKSRSRSRGPFGFLNKKKDEPKEETKAEEKKEEETPATEAVAAEPAATEAAPAGK